MFDNDRLPPLRYVAKRYADARKDFRSFLEVAVSSGYTIPQYYDTVKETWEEAVEGRSKKIKPLSQFKPFL